MSELPSDITQMLRAVSEGDERAVDGLLPVVYERLKAEAHRQLLHERKGNTLNTTALVHEVYLKLVDQRDAKWNDRHHFYRVAAQAMRRILVDQARSKLREKRGSGIPNEPLMEAVLAAEEQPEILIALDSALLLLEKKDERQARIVEFRYFGGYSITETADVLGVSERTVKRDWTVARTFLFRIIASGA